MALNADALANQIIQELGIPAGAAQDKMRVLARVIVEHVQQNAEVTVSVSGVSAGTETAAGSGRLS